MKRAILAAILMIALSSPSGADFQAGQVSLKYRLILVMMNSLSWQRQCMDLSEAVSNPSPNVRLWLLADVLRAVDLRLLYPRKQTSRWVPFYVCL